jgi:hypothetical protein
MKKNKFENFSKSIDQESTRIIDKFNKADNLFNSESSKVKSYSDDLVRRPGISLPKKEMEVVEKIRKSLVTPDIYPTISAIFRAGILALSEMPPEKAKKYIIKLEKLRPGKKVEIEEEKNNQERN